ncbi:MAG TPA: glycerophosphodiester phosphodiesterase [Acidimicrobiales bacterium]|nr:glycerophosphodiester phosphodiesterase [Acidimicrobiales bacterium]
MAVLGHRGASAACPENTIEAFLEAVRLGADGVELDVRRSADGALVVHHDAVIEGVGPVAELTVAELPGSVPLLDAALDACAGLVVNAEIKNLPWEPGWDEAELVARQVAAMVAERRASVIVSSFSLASIDAALAVDGDLVTGLLTTESLDQHQALELVRSRGHRALHPHHRVVTTELVASAHDSGVAVNTWTVDDPERIRWLAGAGVDAIITNRPDVALAALGREVQEPGG